jgi:hypothetical protein
MRDAAPVVCLALLCAAMFTAQSSAAGPIASATAGQGERRLSMKVIPDQCVDFTEVKRGSGPADFRECRVSEFGEFGAVDGETYYYAIYCLIPSYTTEKGECKDDSFIARYHRARALAVFVRDPSSDYARLLFERASPEIASIVYSGKPEIIRNAAGTLLSLPIAVDGTGHGNASEYYLREGRAWARIDAEAWLADLGPRIPNGLEMRKGVWPDLHTMQAEVPIYGPKDGNCCPTGGLLRVRLAIRSRRLVADSIVVEKAR